MTVSQSDLLIHLLTFSLQDAVSFVLPFPASDRRPIKGLSMVVIRQLDLQLTNQLYRVQNVSKFEVQTLGRFPEPSVLMWL